MRMTCADLVRLAASIGSLETLGVTAAIVLPVSTYARWESATHVNPFKDAPMALRRPRVLAVLVDEAEYTGPNTV